MKNFVDPRYLSALGKVMFAEATFELAAQHEFDCIMLEAKQ
jgi:hypothetical protein